MKRQFVSLCMAVAFCLPTAFFGTVAGMSVQSASAAGCKTNSPMIPCSDPALAGHYRSATATVHAYFQALNAGMQSGDFRALASVYAPGATLTQSNPLGQTKVSHGLTQIIAFYKGAYAKLAGYHFTQDAMRSLSTTNVLSYEHAGSPPLSVAARCEHLFVIKNGRIATLDWVTFYAGQK